ncbi:MAG: response regulator transcription factor [Planctomycetaceae bacterium]|nr:response regulator transcription factor [Planctomycetaceae bacterium]
MPNELAGKKILLVDDDRDILASLTAALEELGPEVITASDGNTAVRLANEKQPDLVVLDMMLPKRSGFLVLEQLKPDKNKDTPPRVIMITGNQGTRHRIYAESLGVNKYVQKPFRVDKLLETIRDLLGAAEEK